MLKKKFTTLKDVFKNIREASALKNKDRKFIKHIIQKKFEKKQGNKQASDKKFDIDQQDEHGYTLLDYATQNGYHEIVDILLKQGADIYEMIDKNNFEVEGDLLTALSFISQTSEMMSVCIKHIAENYPKDKELIVKILLEAVSKDKSAIDEEEVLKLINKYINKFNISTKDSNGKTLLDIAVDQGHKKIAEALMVKILFEAVSKDKFEIKEEQVLKLINESINKDNIETTAFDGKTLLYIAAMKGHKAIVEALINKGANVDHQYMGHTYLVSYYLNIYNNSPTLEQDIKEILEIVKIFINAGADLNHLDALELTPMHYLAQYADLEMFKSCVDKGGNIKAVNKEGHSTLFYALNNRDLRVLEFLIKEKQLNINSQDSAGFTPLIFCALHNNNKAAEKLIELGADVSIIAILGDPKSSSWTTTAIGMAEHNCNYGLIKILLQAFAKAPSKAKINEVIIGTNENVYPIHLAAKFGDLELVENLVKNDAELDVLDKNRKKIIYYASQNPNAKVVEYLQQSDINIDELDKIADSNRILLLLPYFLRQTKMLEIEVEDKSKILPFMTAKGEENKTKFNEYYTKLDDDHRKKLFNHYNPENQFKLFSLLNVDLQSQTLNILPEDRSVNIFNELDNIQQKSKIFSYLSGKLQNKLFLRAEKEDRSPLISKLNKNDQYKLNKLGQYLDKIYTYGWVGSNEDVIFQYLTLKKQNKSYGFGHWLKSILPDCFKNIVAAFCGEHNFAGKVRSEEYIKGKKDLEQKIAEAKKTKSTVKLEDVKHNPYFQEKLASRMVVEKFTGNPKL